MKEVIQKIELWSIEKGLNHSCSFKQFAKHSEEAAELVEAFNENEVMLELGDNVVTVTLLAQQNDLNILECWDEVMNPKAIIQQNITILNGKIAEALCKKKGLSKALGNYMMFLNFDAEMMGEELQDCAIAAYMKINNRKGEMVDGIYTKETDL